MVNTFFKTLVFLEEKLLLESGVWGSKDAALLLKRLVHFVESGSVVDSDIEKFIVKNFRLSSADITNKWNEIHYDRLRSKDTIRGQVSVLNRYFCSLFDITANELNDAFITENEEVLMRLSDILAAFDIGDFNIVERFPIFQKYLPDDTTSSVYTVEECAKEINFLKTLDKSVIESMMKEIDSDRLIYVLQTIRQPLLQHYYKKSGYKKSKQKLCSVNQDKVAFYKAFHVMKPKRLKPVDCIETPMGGGVLKEDTAQKSEAASVLELSDCFVSILKKGLDKYQSLPEEHKSELRGKSTEESRQRCRGFFRLFTEEGFRAYLNDLNAYDVACELKGLL